MKPENERSTLVLAIDLAVVMFILTAMFPIAKLPMRLFCLFSRIEKTHQRNLKKAQKFAVIIRNATKARQALKRYKIRFCIST
jgi:hypothetical protein